jgi:hypothetical protein
VNTQHKALHAAVCQAVALLNRSPEVASCAEGREAHTILRQALVDYADAYMDQRASDSEREAVARRHRSRPLRREWRGLTDEEIYEAEDSAGRSFRHHRMSIRGQMITPADGFNWHFAHAIDAKLKELNHE